jgi:hypothetical protein
MRDLTQVLALHPEWRAEVRRLVLTDELLSLPDLVRELTQAQARTEQHLEELALAQARTEQRVEELAQAQARTEQSLKELAQAQARTEQRRDRLDATVQKLVEAQERTEQRVEELAQVQQRMWGDLSRLKGQGLEQQYAQKAASYLGRWLRRVRVVLPGALDAATESQLETRLTLDELQELLRLDVVIAGTTRPPAASREVWLAMEVSSVIDRDDMERARRRAALLRKAGYQAVPVVPRTPLMGVAGEALTQGATELLQTAPIVLMLDGRSEGWEAALAALA